MIFSKYERIIVLSYLNEAMKDNKTSMGSTDMQYLKFFIKKGVPLAPHQIHEIKRCCNYWFKKNRKRIRTIFDLYLFNPSQRTKKALSKVDKKTLLVLKIDHQIRKKLGIITHIRGNIDFYLQ